MGLHCELTFNALASHLETHWSSSCSLKRRFQVQVRGRKILALLLSFYSSIYHNEEGPGFSPYETH